MTYFTPGSASVAMATRWGMLKPATVPVTLSHSPSTQISP